MKHYYPIFFIICPIYIILWPLKQVLHQGGGWNKRLAIMVKDGTNWGDTKQTEEPNKLWRSACASFTCICERTLDDFYQLIFTCICRRNSWYLSANFTCICVKKKTPGDIYLGVVGFVSCIAHDISMGCLHPLHRPSWHDGYGSTCPNQCQVFP